MVVKYWFIDFFLQANIGNDSWNLLHDLYFLQGSEQLQTYAPLCFINQVIYQMVNYNVDMANYYYGVTIYWEKKNESLLNLLLFCKIFFTRHCPMWYILFGLFWMKQIDSDEKKNIYIVCLCLKSLYMKRSPKWPTTLWIALSIYLLLPYLAVSAKPQFMVEHSLLLIRFLFLIPGVVFLAVCLFRTVHMPTTHSLKEYLLPKTCS